MVESLFAGEVDRLRRQSREQDRHVFITSSTRESAFAAYMEAWRLTVERIGTSNYPDVTKQYDDNGTLVLDVTIGRNSQLMEAQLIRSSGNKRLDDAAIRIAKLATPFDPLPTEIARHTDVLHITRTQHFDKSARLITR